MIKNSMIIGLFCCWSLILLSGCSSTRAVTADDFVKKHAKAFYFRDARAVAEMTLCAEDLDRTALPDSIKKEIKEYYRDSLYQNIKRDMKRDDMWSRAWEDTRYERETDHGDHVHVEIKVGYAYTSIVLVRVGRNLKIAPNPSSFE